MLYKLFNEKTPRLLALAETAIRQPTPKTLSKVFFSEKMKNDDLFKIEDNTSQIELIYDANRSLMPAKQLGEAIVGMSNCLRIVGRTSRLEFSDVYVYPLEEGSVKTILVYLKKNKTSIVLGIGFTVTLLNDSLQLIDRFGSSAFKSPSADMLQGVDRRVAYICANTEFRRSLEKVAQPINEANQKVTIKYSNKTFEINCDNQYKFLLEEQIKIFPELINGKTVELVGRLTRMNMVPNNDLGFEYKGRRLSLTPLEEEKDVATEYHQFTPLPQVKVTGVVVRSSEFELPSIKVIRMDEVTVNQIVMFDKKNDKRR